MLWLEGEGDDQLRGSGRGAIAGCHRTVHCSVLWLGRVTANFGGVGVVPLQGAIVVCYGGGRGKNVNIDSSGTYTPMT